MDEDAVYDLEQLIYTQLSALAAQVPNELDSLVRDITTELKRIHSALSH